MKYVESTFKTLITKAIFCNKHSQNYLYFRRPTSGLLENDSMRIVITAPDKDLLLQQDDVAFMLVQYEESEEEASMYTATNSK